MNRVVGIWLFTSLFGLGRGHNTLFQGYDQTLSGYHLCSVNESVLVTHVISYSTSYIQRRPCGGWLPWTMCNVAVYKTSYRTEFYNMSKQVMKCCHGYEHVGSYCALSLNRSTEFTSKPGLCPSGGVTGSLGNDANPSGSVCRWDIDCLTWQKCCRNENIYQCSDPLPSANKDWCFNATITVKAPYELVTMDQGLFNHTRLLHAVVTGALGTNGISVHHLWSRAEGPFTTSSSLLVCSSVALSLTNISTQLYRLGNIEEVTSVMVEDVDECANQELNNCSRNANCINTDGSYSCVCHDGFQNYNHTQSGTVCIAPTPPSTTENLPTTSPYTMGPTTYTDGKQDVTTGQTTSQTSLTCDYIPEISSIVAYNVTNSTFIVSWTTNIQTGVNFHLVLLQGITELGNFSTTSLHFIINNLNPAVLYTVRVTAIACGNMGGHVEVKVRTDGQMVGATARLTNVEYRPYMSNPNSEDYKMFCQSVIHEIYSSLPAEISQLVLSGEITIRITSLSNGSVIVNFSIVFLSHSDLGKEKMLNVSNALMTSLQNSSKYTVDSNSIHIDDLNECSLAMADCSPWADCTNTFGSYTCDCRSGYTDLSLSRPGRSCAVSLSTSTTPPSSSIVTISNVAHTTNNPIKSLLSTTTTPSVQQSTTSRETTTTLNSNGPVTSSTTESTSLRSKSSLITYTVSSEKQASNHLPAGDKITVECSPGFISVTVRQDFLDANNILNSSLYLGQPECGPSGGNLTHLHLGVAWSKCGTTLEHNSTNITINTTLLEKAPSVRMAVPIICTYPSSINISAGYSPTGYFDLIKDVVQGSGSFQVTVRLLNGSFPLPENYRLTPDEEVIVEVAVNTSIPQIKVIINKCWATPTKDSSQPTSYLFLDNGCPSAHTKVIKNGNDTVALLAVRVFALAEEEIIYLHCQIQICLEIQDNTCKPICGPKSFRSSNLIGVTKASFGPLLRLNKLPPINSTSNTIQVVGFVLLGVGLVLFVLAAVVGLVYHKRKIGNYNFSIKPQQENFTYHVFHT